MIPSPEDIRLSALYSLGLLDTPASESFDRITRMASQIFDLPIAAISLTDTDRQWFKSRVGVEHQSIPRERAPCAEVAEKSTMLVIPDMAEDAYYSESNLGKSGVRFCAGAPLTTREGHGLGALCVLGLEPRRANARELAALEDLAAMVMAQIELQHAYGRIDPVSGLPNRTQFFEDLSDLIKEPAKHLGRRGILVDLAEARQLDDLSRVLGPTRIDATVREAAQRLRAAMDFKKNLYHVSATQFAFIEELGNSATHFPPNLGELLAELEDASSFTILMTPAIGVAVIASDDTPEDILRAMSSAARDARLTPTKVEVYSKSSDDRHQRSFRLLQDFDNALKSNDQLSLVFQPRVNLANDRCIGAEVLLRWQHPVLGSISPGEFAPIIEQSPYITKMTAWVVDAALRQSSLWKASGIHIPLSVNISAANLEEVDFVQKIVLALLRHGIVPEMLELEVTESAIMKNAANCLAKLSALSEGGIRLSIDDFGTGYSSLSYLQKLPTTVVKIDQSFIHDLNLGHRQRNLVHSMIKLSQDLGYQVVAEGVETLEVADILKTMGCDDAQGYLFAKPLRPAEFESWFWSDRGTVYRPLKAIS
ncbi:putative bifunctional diguanylate cyclase/phosphodiesterase [Aliirhizobium smilacinae]|uniref:EAL domain-containing protein n=1 Tax=Aliirhizobium smilacinae TaxID=1395944 RepID=A0A5C4XBQ1_9HYPH|nr:GGDEF and EAL domain-containing protein [Rhizobium smilacinae]TNM60251.1 EAL domain-containing protein [Rhizobium smilacinae]